MPTPTQESVMRRHCAHARFVWNLAVEQQSWWRTGRKNPPRWAEQCRQLTDARTEFAWLADGAVVVQQQALRDFAVAMSRFFAGTSNKPGWRKARCGEGFRVTSVGRLYHHRRLSRHVGAVQVPKLGWVKFRWSRPVPEGVKSYRVTMDRAGRWHVAFSAIPDPITSPGTGEVIGIDRGIVVTLALSDGTMYQAPESRSPGRLQRRLYRAKRGSNRRAKVKARLARIHAHNANARKDWAEKASTDIARRYDVIRIEGLQVINMTRSARGTADKPGRNVRAKTQLNRKIHASGWALFATRLAQKAPGRVEKISPHFTSQTCNACGHCERGNRKSQAFFCLACGHRDHADINAAKNIAAGHAVTARGGSQLEPASREPTAA